MSEKSNSKSFSQNSIDTLIGAGMRIEGDVSCTGEVVVRRDQSTELGSSVMYAPVVEYVNVVTNNTARFEDPLATSPATHKVGDIVAVLFNPSKPSQACIDSAVRLYVPAALVFGGGVIILLVVTSGGFH